MHDYVPLIVLILGVFAGIWLNRRDYAELKADNKEFKADILRMFDAMNKRMDRIDARLDRIDSRLDRIDEDLRQFYGTDKALEARVNELSSRIK